jgi:outer membrane protein assembly factor BamA
MAAHQPSTRHGVGGLICLLVAASLAASADARAEVSFVPVPEIILDPNEGNTYGVMGVWMFLNEQSEIQYMVAPDIRYNETKGVYPTFRLFGYPTLTRRYTIALGKSTTKDESYEAEYYDRGLLDGRAFLRGYAVFEQDSTERFFGFGNNSKEDNEANYTSRTLEGWIEPGYWIVPTVYVSYRVRVRRISTSAGQVSGVPFLTSCNPDPSQLRNEPPWYCMPVDRPGRERFIRRTNTFDRGRFPGHYFSNRMEFGYDTRDSIDLPSQGAYSRLYFEFADRALGSSTSYTKFGVDSRGYIPLRGEKKNPIIALRATLDYVTGPSDTPFWERSAVGGRRSVRGFGSDRFIGFNRSVGSAELRTNVYQRRLFGVKAELELAPFVDAGQVWKGVTENPVDDLHWAYGLGFRFIVRPQILAFVDVGQGDEGLKVFTGIDYPF